MNCAELHL